MDGLELAVQTVTFSASAGYGTDGARSLERAADRGTLARLRRGAYAPSSQPPVATQWRSQQVRLLLERAVAVVGTRSSALALSHHAAAAAWGMPIAGGWPARVDVLATAGNWSRSDPGVKVHRARVDASELVDLAGITVTSPERTVFDLARSGAVDDALVALDAGLCVRGAGRGPGVDLEIITAMIQAAPSPRGLAMARGVAGFADAASGSPGESCSRLAIYRAGFARPELQVRHPSTRRRYYETDFEWPELGVIGEFDGRGKYFKEGLDGTVDPGQAIYDEKLREDELRAQCTRFVRWGWREVHRPALLRELLLAVGIPLVRPPRRILGPW